MVHEAGTTPLYAFSDFEGSEGVKWEQRFLSSFVGAAKMGFRAPRLRFIHYYFDWDFSNFSSFITCIGILHEWDWNFAIFWGGK